MAVQPTEDGVNGADEEIWVVTRDDGGLHGGRKGGSRTETAAEGWPIVAQLRLARRAVGERKWVSMWVTERQGPEVLTSCKNLAQSGSQDNFDECGAFLLETLP